MNKTAAGSIIAALVVIDVALVAAARLHVFGTPPDSDIDMSKAASSVSDGSGQQGLYSPDPARLGALGLANDGFVVSAVRGTCDAQGQVVQMRASRPGTQQGDTRDSGLTTVLALQARAGGVITAVGQDASCRVRQVVSKDGGRTWSASPEVTLWHVDPQDSTRVVSGRVTGEPGCDVVSVSGVTAAVARVACSDGTLMGSGDSGKTWTRLGRLNNLRQITFTSPTAGLALARHNGCAAHAFTTKDGGATWTLGGCIAGEPAQALAASTNGYAAMVDDHVFLSTDAMEWNQR